MNARWWWFGYALAVAVVLGAMGWFTATVCAGHAAERRAERAAFADETARLALWRMDSRLATVIAREAGRQHDDHPVAHGARGPDTAVDKPLVSDPLELLVASEALAVAGGVNDAPNHLARSLHRRSLDRYRPDT